MPALKRKRCPHCGKRYAYVSFEKHKPYPFCSERCQSLDLGSWLDEEYRVTEDVSEDFELLSEPEYEFDDE